MKIIELEIEKVIPYAGNPRKNAAAVDKVAASIKEYGWRQPIVVDAEMVIIAGHTRYLAAQKLGLKKVPVHVATDLDPLKVKAYRLADNRTHEEAEWDNEALALELKMLLADDYDLRLMGFDPAEINKIIGEIDTAEEDLPVEPDDEKKYLLMIEFDSESELEEYYNTFTEEGRKCKIIE